MKQVFTFLAAVLLTASVFAQSPEKMSYQSVIRNSSDQLVTGQVVGMQISILQGSAGGPAVYVETQTPTTNANGLISIEIGAGTVQSGDFTTIDWANGSYFIKTETDLAGGANYTITGTSQLLSVPYALHAKTAETLSGGITETDPIFVASPANGILSGDISNWNSAFGWGNHATEGYLTSFTETDPIFVASPANGILSGHISNWNSAFGWGNHATEGYLTSFTETDPVFTAWDKDYNDLINKPTIDGSETKLTAGINVIVIGAGTTASPYVINTTDTLAIGDSYQGGIIFWLDATGQHGLIAATADQSAGIQWYNETSRYTGTTGDGLYAGAMNTAMIVATQMADNQTGNFAAKVCADYSVTEGGVIYGDWYLPSKYELNLLYIQKTTVGGFASASYWSSTENNNEDAWIHIFDDGYPNDYGKHYTGGVRAVRAF